MRLDHLLSKEFKHFVPFHGRERLKLVKKKEFSLALIPAYFILREVGFFILGKGANIESGPIAQLVRAPC